MVRILIVYETTEGQTAKIAQAIGSRLRQQGAHADVFSAGATGRSVSATHYDGVIVAGSVHIGRYQRKLRAWVRNHAFELKMRPAAFVSVSLGVLSKSAKAEKDLKAIVDRFADDTGWQPPLVKHVAGALLYTRYNFFTRWAMERIAAAEHGSTDTTRDHEYTDWKDVREFADRFHERVAHTTKAA